jgi:hypothetical protein
MTAHIVPNKEDIKFRQDMARLANTNSGQAILRAIMRECGFQKPSILANPQSGEINPMGTVYNEARRNIWLWLRKAIPSDKLALIETADMPNGQAEHDDLAGV